MAVATKKRILVIEDDKLLAVVIQKKVAKLGYDVFIVNNGDDGYNKAISNEYSLIICDIALPSTTSEITNGFTIVEKMKKQGMKTPIIIITDNATKENEMKTFVNGANIFHKKIDYDLLAVQVISLIDSYKLQAEIERGDIVLDPAKETFKKAGISYELTRKEFILMLILLSSPGEVFSRREILSKYVTRMNSEESSVDTLVSRLRRKLGKYKGEEVIETIHGRGFRLSLKYLETKQQG